MVQVQLGSPQDAIQAQVRDLGVLMVWAWVLWKPDALESGRNHGLGAGAHMESARNSLVIDSLQESKKQQQEEEEEHRARTTTTTNNQQQQQQQQLDYYCK